MNDARTIRDLMDLSGRVALVTGGAGHIGREAALALAELGAAVAVLDLDRVAAERVAAEVSTRWSTQAFALGVDLEDEDAVRQTPVRTTDALGGLDIVVNCAALVGSSELPGWAVPLEQQSSGAWRLALEVNLTAPFLLVQAALPYLRRSGHGSVINVASIYGMVGPDMSLYRGTGMGNPAAYGVSKGGLLQLTRWLATVLAPQVRVNAVTPGGIERSQPEEFQRRYQVRTPLRRMGHEEDVKGAIVFLATDLSAYVTGQNLVVDGGWTAW